MPGDSTEPPGSPSLPPTCPRTPSVLGGLAGRAEPLPQLLEGLPTLQQDPRAPPEVLAAGSRGGREGLHSPDGSAPTCGAISHWGGGQLVTGGASLLGGGAGNGHGDTKHCCHGPKIRSGSQRYRTDTGQAALPWHSQPSPGAPHRGAPAPNPPVCCEGGQLCPAAGMESCLPRCHCRGWRLQGATGAVPNSWPRWPPAQRQGHSARAVCWEPLLVPCALPSSLCSSVSGCPSVCPSVRPS